MATAQERPGGEAGACPGDWPNLVADEQWEVYRRVIDAARERGLRFALGGAFALATYTGYIRNTKDLDIYILPQDREAIVQILTDCGLEDYYDQLPYDRGWIYRSHNGETILDAIWAMANRRADVDDMWLTRGPQCDVRGERLHVIPAEEIVWAKLFIVQRDRCDWVDLLNIVHAAGPTMDWEHLLYRLGDDVPLLRGLLCVFQWLSPARAAELPAWLWQRLQLPPPAPPGEQELVQRRADLLDTRPWYHAAQPALQNAPQQD